MSVRPKRDTTYGGHPGKIVNDTMIKRRTRAEIDADNAAKKAAKEAKKALADEKKMAALAKRKAASYRTAAKEDSVQKEQNQVNSMRPDIRTMETHQQLVESKLRQTKEYSPKEIGELDDDEKGNSPGFSDEELPPISTISTDSDREPEVHPTIDSVKFRDSDVSDSEYELHESEDEDEEEGEMEVDEEWQEFIRRRAENKAKKEAAKLPSAGKVERGELRNDINKLREHIPKPAPVVSKTTGNKKRKASNAADSNIKPVDVSSRTVPKGKRAKPAEFGGLKPNWKRKVGLIDGHQPEVTAPTGAGNRASSPEEQLDDSVGEFTNDETTAAITAARESKKAKKPEPRTVTADKSTAKVGIVLRDVKTELRSVNLAIGRVREAKPRYTNSHLPFANHNRDLKIWQNSVLPAIIDWAGTLDNFFKPNAHNDFNSTIEEHWAVAFPTIDINDAVYTVASSSIRNWRSDIGKRALKFYNDLFAKSEPYKSSPNAIKGYVADSLKDVCFIYRNPETFSGAYRSDVLCKVFAVHLQIVLKTETTYGHPIGAMSGCAAAVERALILWQNGTPPSDENKRNFVEKPWGNRALSYLEGIKRLSDMKWREIFVMTSEKLRVSEEVIDLTGGEPEGAGSLDPRAQVFISDDDG